jgi:hypothetical protein
MNPSFFIAKAGKIIWAVGPSDDLFSACASSEAQRYRRLALLPVIFLCPSPLV